MVPFHPPGDGHSRPPLQAAPKQAYYPRSTAAPRAARRVARWPSSRPTCRCPALATRHHCTSTNFRRSHPLGPCRQRTVRHGRRGTLRCSSSARPTGMVAAPHSHHEVRARPHPVPLLARLQAGEEVGVSPILGIRDEPAVRSSGCWLTTQGGIDLIEVGATMHRPPKYATLLPRLDRRQQIGGHLLQRLIDRLRRFDG
jgi:hypothetical protein